MQVTESKSKDSHGGVPAPSPDACPQVELTAEPDQQHEEPIKPVDGAQEPVPDATTAPPESDSAEQPALPPVSDQVGEPAS